MSPTWRCLLGMGEMCSAGHLSSVLGLNHQNNLWFFSYRELNIVQLFICNIKKNHNIYSCCQGPRIWIIATTLELLPSYFRHTPSQPFLFIIARFLVLNTSLLILFSGAHNWFPPPVMMEYISSLAFKLPWPQFVSVIQRNLHLLKNERPWPVERSR